MNEENKKNTEEEKELKVICLGCGFSAHSEEFDTCLSVYHDLRCPKCSTTSIDWTYGKYKDNTLMLD